MEELDSEKVSKISSTDNRVPKFAGTAGDLEQSGITVDDSNNVTGVNDLTVNGDLTVQGTTVTLNTATLDVQDQNITVAKGGNDAAAEGAGITVDRTSTKGSLVFDSTKSSKWKAGLLGSEVELADLTSAQTLTNKTLDNPIGNVLNLTEQGSSPSTPSAGTKKLYAKTDGKVYTKDSTGLEKQVGSGAGGGSKNYLGNINGVNNGGDFEDNTVGSWVLGTATLTNNLPSGAPTFGSGASADLSIAIVGSGSQIAGSYSLRYLSNIASTAGNFLASPAFTIDQSDQAKVMTVKFYYKVQAGASNANWSGTSANSLGWAIYDVTNSAWIIPAGAFGMTQSSGVGICTGTFQTTANSTQYRLVVYNANASSGGFTLYFDDFSLGPQTAPIGTTIVTQSSKLEQTATLAASTTLTGALTSSSGSGVYTYNSGTGVYTMVRDAHVHLSGSFRVGSTQVQIVIETNGSTGVAADFIDTGSAFASAAWSGKLASGETFRFLNSSGAGNSDIQRVYVLAEAILTTQMSNDTDTRVISSRVYKSGTQAFSSETKITSWTVDKDRAGMWDASNNRWNIPVSGDYVLALNISAKPTTTASQVSAYKINGGTTIYVGSISIVNGQSRFGGAALLPDLKAGDYVEVYQFTSAATTVNAGTNETSASLFRLSGPSVIAASESVNMKYTNTAGTSVANSGDTVIPFANKQWDSHNAYNTSTGLYTCPVSGKYRVSATVDYVSSTYAATNVAVLRVYQNGASVSIGQVVIAWAAIAAEFGNSVYTTLNCNAGDTIGIYGFNNRSAGATTLATGATVNHLEIERVGN